MKQNLDWYYNTLKKLSTLLIFGVLLLGCVLGNPLLTSAKAKQKPYFKKTSVKIYCGTTKQLKLRRAKGRITWKSSKKSVVSVSKKGKITGKKPGKAYIVAKCRNGKRKCRVTVKRGYTLSFAKKQVSIEVGEKYSNPAKKSNVYADQIRYSSSDPMIAEVDHKGVVTAKQAGEVRITARGSQDTKSYQVHIPQIIWSDATHFIAHKGYTEFEQENTLAAFRAALDLGFWGIETDVYMTKDGVFVLSHDACLWGKWYTRPEDLTDEVEQRGMIAELTYEQLVRLTNGKIATVEELLQLLRGHQEIPLLELKEVVSSQYPTETEVDAFYGTADPRSMEEKRNAYAIHALLELVEQYDRLDSCYITSFHPELIEEVRRQNATIQIQYITMEKSFDLDYLCSHHFGLDWYLPHANEADVKKLKSHGVNVCLWTADNRAQIEKALNLGADAITTNTHFFRYRR